MKACHASKSIIAMYPLQLDAEEIETVVLFVERHKLWEKLLGKFFKGHAYVMSVPKFNSQSDYNIILRKKKYRWKHDQKWGRSSCRRQWGVTGENWSEACPELHFGEAIVVPD